MIFIMLMCIYQINNQRIHKITNRLNKILKIRKKYKDILKNKLINLFHLSSMNN